MLPSIAALNKLHLIKSTFYHSQNLTKKHLENYEPVKSAAVCSAHFKNTDYEPNHTNRKLRKDAVPYLLETEIQPAIQIDLHHQNTIQENTTIEKNNNVAVYYRQKY